MDSGIASRFTTLAAGGSWLAAEEGRESTSMRIDASSVILVCLAGADADEALCAVSAGVSVAAAFFLFRWIGGALGSLGFRGFLVFGSVLPSAATLGLTTEPGLRPGFFRGRPAAVSCTSGWGRGGCMTPNLGPEAVSTTISSISMFALPCWSLDGEPGSEIEPDGGDDNTDAGDEL